MRIDNRTPSQLREITLQPHSFGFAEGSVLASFGKTTVLCNATVDSTVPRWLKESNHGWITAEYAMLPRATSSRNSRESVRGKQQGRSVEISRLIARALRASVDYKALPPVNIVVDCDVLQADGGTRTTAISGASVALVLALATAKQSLTITKIPEFALLQAVSVGLVQNEVVADLNYYEDSRAQVDATIITSGGNLVEVAFSGEGYRFTRQQFDTMVDVGLAATNVIKKQQQTVLTEALQDMFVNGKEKDLDSFLTYLNN